MNKLRHEQAELQVSQARSDSGLITPLVKVCSLVVCSSADRGPERVAVTSLGLSPQLAPSQGRTPACVLGSGEAWVSSPGLGACTGYWGWSPPLALFMRVDLTTQFVIQTRTL